MKTFAYIFLYSLCSLIAIGQPSVRLRDMEQIPASPNAASLGKYGHIPVDLSSGMASVSVPLFELQSQSLQLNLTLGYHHNGFRPSEQESWVGLGWSLQGTGIITRQVKGIPDEQATTPYERTQLCQGKNPQSEYPRIRDNYSKYASQPIDISPDIYTFHIPGASGKFIVYRDSTQGFKPQVYHLKHSDVQIKVHYHTDKPAAESQYFSLTTADGTVYHFDVYETTHSLSQTHNARYISAWYLHKITAAHGLDQILFNYASTHETVKYSLNLSDSYAQIDPQGSRKYLGHATLYHDCAPNQGKPDNGVQVSSITSQAPVLQSIESRYQRLEFQRYQRTEINALPHTGTDTLLGPPILPLKKITLLHKGNYQHQRHIHLAYRFIGQQHPRLALASVSSVASDGTKLPAYHFEYYGEENPFPLATTLDIDHWGYYNAAGNTRLIPAGIIPQQKAWLNAQRAPNFEALRQGTLYQVHYPTGGRSIFEYQPNDFYHTPSQSLRPAPGLRIHRITTHNGHHQIPQIKKYRYTTHQGEAIHSSGQLMGHDGSLQNYLHQTTSITCTEKKSVGGGMPLCSKAKQCSYYLLASHYQHSPTLAPYVHHYTQVTELLGEHGQQGKTSYEYTITSLNYAHVQLQRQQTWSAEGRLLASTQHHYAITPDAYPNAPKILGLTDFTVLYYRSPDVPLQNHDTQGEIADAEGYIYGHSTHEFKFYKVNLHKTVHANYHDDNQVTTTTTRYAYTSPYHNYPTRIAISQGTGDTLITRTKYPADYHPNIAQYLVAKNIQNIPLEEILLQHSQATGQTHIMGGKITLIDSLYLLPTKVYTLEIPQALPMLDNNLQVEGKYMQLISDSHFKTQAVYTYNAQAQLIQQQKTDALPMSYTWGGYQNQFPIAKTLGAKANDVFYTSFEEISNLPTTTQAHTGTHAFAGTSYTLPIQPQAGTYHLSYWEWETAKNRWTLHQNSNYPYTSGAITIRPSSPTNFIDDVRLCPQYAQMATFTYTPLKGISTQTNFKHQTTHYYYDAHGRLQNVKDFEGNMVKQYKYHYRHD